MDPRLWQFGDLGSCEEVALAKLDAKIPNHCDFFVIPRCIDQYPCAHWRIPMDMMRQG